MDSNSVDRVSKRVSHAHDVQRELFELFEDFDYAYTVTAKEGESKIRDAESFSHVETVAVRFIGNDPQLTFRPEPGSGTDEGNAEQVSRLFDEWKRKSDYLDFLNRWGRRTLKHGTAIAYLSWKTVKREVDQYLFDDSGLPVPNPSALKQDKTTGEFYIADDAQFLTEKVTVTDYDDPDIDLVDTYGFYIDPEADSIEKARWIVFSYKATKDELKAKGKRYKNLNELHADANRDYTSEHKTDQDAAYNKVFQADDDTVDRYLVYEMWERHDDGSIWVVSVSCGQEIENRKSPHWYPSYPVVPLYDVRTDSTFWGIGEIQPIIANQHLIDSYNALENANKQLVAQPPIKKYGDVDDGQLTGDPFSIIELGAKVNGNDVEFMIVPDSTTTISATRQELRNSNKNALGTFDYAKGGDPGSGNDTASGIATVVEQANIRFRHKDMQMMAANKKVAEIVVSFYQQYMHENRQIEILGEEGAREMINVSPKSIAGRYNIETIEGSNRPRSVIIESDISLKQYEIARMLFPQDPQYQAELAQKVIKKLGETTGIDEVIQQAIKRQNEQLLLQQQAIQSQAAFGQGAELAPLAGVTEQPGMAGAF